MEDIEILKKIRSGNYDEFVKLYQKYFDKIYRYIYTKTYNKEVTEDICSITFIKALENINKFKGDGTNFRSWLYKIAGNQIIDYYRKTRMEQNIDDIWDLKSVENIEIDQINKESFDSLYKHLHKLKKTQRDVIIQHIWDEMTFKEISLNLGISEGKCKMTFYRSVNILKNSLLEIIMVLIKLNPLLPKGGFYE